MDWCVTTKYKNIVNCNAEMFLDAYLNIIRTYTTFPKNKVDTYTLFLNFKGCRLTKLTTNYKLSTVTAATN